MALMAASASALRPVFEIADGSGRRSVVGTAIIVEGLKTRYVLTAEHVLAGPRQKLIGVPEAEAIPWPEEYSTLISLDSSAPNADVAWVEIADRMHELSPGLPSASLSGWDADAMGATYLAVGFPVSRSKVLHPSRQVKAKLMFAVVAVTPETQSSKRIVDKRVQLGLEYSQHGRLDIDGRHVTGPFPRGMSGGAIFLMLEAAMPDGTKIPFPQLVGIFTEFHKSENCIVSTRVSQVGAGIGLNPGGSCGYQAVRQKRGDPPGGR